MVYKNKSMVVGTKTYGCGNKNLWLWEQNYFLGGKSMVGKTNHRLWEQIYGKNNKNVGNELITR
jgi:hypothetical protein